MFNLKLFKALDTTSCFLKAERGRSKGHHEEAISQIQNMGHSMRK